MSEQRKSRRTEIGTVERGPRHKTIVVKSTRLVEHPKYHRYVRRISRYTAHDEKEETRLGDTVEIAETRPISKTKSWRLVRVVARGNKESEAVS